MDEFVKEENNGQAEFYLATMTGGTKDEGLTFTIDGQSSSTTKKYKLLLTGKEPPRTGDRILVMKISGTYIVLGKIGMPGYWWKFAPIQPSDQTLPILADKIDYIYQMFADTGIARREN